LDDTEASGGSPDLRQQLQAIRQEPQVRRTALRLAGDRELAEDVIQAACCALAALKDPDRIDNLRGYFFRVLRNEATKLYASRETPYEDPERAIDPDQPGTALCGLVSARPIDETVCFWLQAESWLRPFADQCEHLLAAVPDRSFNPVRYREVIVAAAERVLRDAINGEPSDADSSDALRAAYPDYFDQADAAPNTLYKRFSRAREDVRALLQGIVNRDELFWT
jgi:DNA-directed RNA polymerase specialized sigma24 family protein